MVSNNDVASHSINMSPSVNAFRKVSDTSLLIRDERPPCIAISTSASCPAQIVSSVAAGLSARSPPLSALQDCDTSGERSTAALMPDMPLLTSHAPLPYRG